MVCLGTPRAAAPRLERPWGSLTARSSQQRPPNSLVDCAQVAKLVDEAYATCKETLAQYRPLLDATVDALLEKETIDGFELDDLVEKYTGKPAPNPRPEAIAV